MNLGLGFGGKFAGHRNDPPQNPMHRILALLQQARQLGGVPGTDIIHKYLNRRNGTKNPPKYPPKCSVRK